MKLGAIATKNAIATWALSLHPRRKWRKILLRGQIKTNILWSQNNIFYLLPLDVTLSIRSNSCLNYVTWFTLEIQNGYTSSIYHLEYQKDIRMLVGKPWLRYKVEYCILGYNVRKPMRPHEKKTISQKMRTCVSQSSRRWDLEGWLPKHPNNSHSKQYFSTLNLIDLNYTLIMSTHWSPHRYLQVSIWNPTSVTGEAHLVVAKKVSPIRTLVATWSISTFLKKFKLNWESNCP